MSANIQSIFDDFNKFLNEDFEKREAIKLIIREIENASAQAQIALQVIHSDLKQSSEACKQANQRFAECQGHFLELSKLIPVGEFYRYHDRWHHTTQRLISAVALTVYLEEEVLVTREMVAEKLGLKVHQNEGFHLDLEDYLMGLLNLASELSRLTVNAVTQADYDRPLRISNFVGDLNAGFRLLNLKNSDLRKRYDVLKYDVKKIEEVVYDINIRGLQGSNKP